jgi:hypothetical protein
MPYEAVEANLKSSLFEQACQDALNARLDLLKAAARDRRLVAVRAYGCARSRRALRRFGSSGATKGGQEAACVGISSRRDERMRRRQ